jgi:predicted O-methyltransferase YrrM
MSTDTLSLDTRTLRYLRAVSLREPPLLAQLREETAKLPMARMQIAPEQGQFMSLLVKLLGAERAIEIGTFTGYSALCVATAQPPEGRLVCCDISEEWTAIARRYFEEAGLANKIELRLKPAKETLFELLDSGQAGQFDFAFIDADKECYPAYYELCLKLLRKGGLIAIDNTLWSGKLADPNNTEADSIALREFNTRLHQDARVDLSLVPIGDGLTLARKRG